MIKIEITLDNIQYGEILEQLLPYISSAQTGELGYVAAGIRKFGRASVDMLPESAKEKMAVSVLNSYKDRLRHNLETSMKQNGVAADIREIKIEGKKAKPGD